MIYLDNAATTMQKPPEVVDAVVRALTTMGNASRGASDASLAADRSDYACRQLLGRLFGCPAGRVCFCSNSTEALNTAIMGLTRPGDHVVATDLDHNSVLRPLYRLRDERGVQVDFAPADGRGRLDYRRLRRLVTPGTRMVVCTHASNVTGDLVDVPLVAQMAHDAGAIMVLDASQTAGSHDVNMERLGVDVLCFTGHKGLMGPQGTGGICVGPDILIEPLKVGGSGVQSFLQTQPPEYPTRLEAGTLNSHGIAGLGAAVGFVLRTGVDTIGRHEDQLARRFAEGVRGIDGVRLYGDLEQPGRSAIVSLNVRDYSSAEVSDALWNSYGIATRPGAHCAPRMHHALGTERQGVVRFSFGWYNTSKEVDAAVEAVAQLAS